MDQRSGDGRVGGRSKVIALNFSGVRCAALWEVSHPLAAHQLLRGWSPFFGIFAAVNWAVIDTVMAHVNVHIDCHLISCYASLYQAS